MITSEQMYVPTEELEPVGDPDREVHRALTDASSSDWKKQVLALTQFRRLAIHHPRTLQPLLHAAMKPLLPAVDSLRSGVAKNAIMAMTDVFKGLGKGADGELEFCVPVLLKKAADTAGFIGSEAEHALDVMVEQCSESKALSALLGASRHKSPVVRLKSARWLFSVVEKLGPRMSEVRDLEGVIKAGVAFMHEGNEETRHAGKRLLLCLNAVGVLDARVADRVLGASDAIRVRELLERGMSDVLPTPSGERATRLGSRSASAAGSTRLLGTSTIAGGPSPASTPAGDAMPPRVGVRAASAARRP